MIVAISPAPGRLAFSTIAWMACAPSCPSRPRTCAKISPRAASCAEEQPGDGDGQDQDRRQREHRVERERRALARSAVVDPFHTVSRTSSHASRRSERHETGRSRSGTASGVTTALTGK